MPSFVDGIGSEFEPPMPFFQDPETYRDILDGLQIGVSVLDLQKRIVFWSDGAEQITGYTRIEVLGHACTDNILQHCNQNSCELCAERCPITAALHGAKPVEGIGFVHHKSGHRIPVHTWAIPLRDKHGSIVGIIQSFGGEVVVNGPNPNDQRMKERGWLDLVTGLPNQAMMQSHLREALGTFADLEIPFAVVCVEVHEFGPFRARYGQEAATSMLQVLARSLRNTVWPTDFVGRWNENQYLVILCGCGEDALQAVVGRMRRMMSNATIVWWGEELAVRISIGHAYSVAKDTIASILQRAQQGLVEGRAARPAAQAGGAQAAAVNVSSQDLPKTS
jgi:diguanylate cyclase (GGDEF)-like protein/PAS domain S-box-containing protein